MSAPGLGALAAVEGTKALRQPATRILFAILAGYLVLMVLAFTSILGAPEMEGFDKESFLGPLRQDAVGFTLSIFTGTAVIVAVVFAANLVGQEFSRGTLRTLLLSRARRLDVALAKAGVLVAASLLLALLGLVAGVAGAWAFGQAVGEDLLQVDAGALAWRGLGLFGALAVWSLVAFAVTLWTRSLGAGIGVAIALVLAGDVLVGLVGGLGDVGLWASRVTPNAGVAVLARAAPPSASTWAWALPNLLAYGVGLPALAAWRFRRIDALAATK